MQHHDHATSELLSLDHVLAIVLHSRMQLAGKDCRCCSRYDLMLCNSVSCACVQLCLD